MQSVEYPFSSKSIIIVKHKKIGKIPALVESSERILLLREGGKFHIFKLEPFRI